MTTPKRLAPEAWEPWPRVALAPPAVVPSPIGGRAHSHHAPPPVPPLDVPNASGAASDGRSP